jgi:transposase InsO family protein
MRQIYQQARLSKQAHAQWVRHQSQREEDTERIIAHIHEQRMLQPRIGLRKLYGLFLQDPGQHVGRDRFIDVGVEAGLGVPRAVNRLRTTYAVASSYPNLLVGKTLTDVNQVWVSDITYYWTGEGFSYITLLMDLYSRMIVGAVAAESMHAYWSVAVLSAALAARQIPRGGPLIHHSDQGSQYLSNDYLAVLESFAIAVSTAQIVYENAHAERVNGIIKLEYLDAWSTSSHRALVENLPVAVERFNTIRPHGSLGGISPFAFEESLKTTLIDAHPPMAIWPQQPLLKLTQGVDVPYILT